MPLGNVAVAAFNKTWTGKVLRRKVVPGKSLFNYLFIYSGHLIIDKYYEKDVKIVLLKSIADQEESKRRELLKLNLDHRTKGLKFIFLEDRQENNQIFQRSQQ